MISALTLDGWEDVQATRRNKKRPKQRAGVMRARYNKSRDACVLCYPAGLTLIFVLEDGSMNGLEEQCDPMRCME